MTDLADRVLAYAREAGHFTRGGVALLAVSGGEDSMALLELFVRIGPALGLQLAVGHVDHGIAPESADVAEQVLGWVARRKLRAHLRVLNLGPAGETRAREERYRALRELQRETAADYLVTAHHADDQAETVLFRFLRGSAPAGLAGIPERGPHGLVRPLLPFARAELHQWLCAQYPAGGPQPPVYHDPANRDPRHDRSWLRSDLLPMLRNRFGPSVHDHLHQVQVHAAAERKAWSELLRQLPELDFQATAFGVDVARAPLRTYDKALREALLRATAREAGCLLGPTRAAKLAVLIERGSSGRTLQLGQGWEASLVFERVRVERRPNHDAPVPAGWGEPDSGSLEFGKWAISGGPSLPA